MASALAADPTGDWRVADGVANVRVAQCNGSMWGVVAWEKEPGGVDRNNPDASKRNRPTLGLPILLDMKKKPGADSWEGQVYNAKDGQTYSASITPTDPNHLEIQGCVLGFLCGGETWTRVAPPIPSSPANSMARGASKAAAAKPAASKAGLKTAAATPARTTSSIRPGAKGHGQGDAIGDICLLPDLARLTH
ncbi:MAG TPA: DUF2147 domain-containing protein [Bradyrhizobium sp.]|uniref:DUF2147 domain-containing protein n=1 Tax=Bradyrhizobium sp. TaxID=376 RepID=UPI002CB4A8F5|nr:DUF2147 domain-containing protein [Bradyrhizobium sp.]HLZ02424.1 DUF2147 domain-containing protein [Bradyrhizobium sp.]